MTIRYVELDEITANDTLESDEVLDFTDFENLRIHHLQQGYLVESFGEYVLFTDE